MPSKFLQALELAKDTAKGSAKSYAKSRIKEEANEVPQGFLGKAVDTLAIPQQYVSQRLANSIGIVPQKSSEKNFQEIAQAVAEKISQKTGINPDSPQANALKAIGVAGAEVFLDPLNILPVGKIAKYGGKAMAAAPKIAKSIPALEKALAAGGKLTKKAESVITPIFQQEGGRATYKAREQAKALASAQEKLRLAKQSGEGVGVATGVDLRSTKALNDAAANLVPKNIEPQIKYESVKDFINKTRGE